MNVRMNFSSSFYTSPPPQKSLEFWLGLHYNHRVIWGRTDIFTKLNLSIQKQDAFLYLSKCWSPPRGDWRVLWLGAFLKLWDPVSPELLQLLGTCLCNSCSPTDVLQKVHVAIRAQESLPHTLHDNVAWLMQGGALESSWTFKLSTLNSKEHWKATLWSHW